MSDAIDHHEWVLAAPFRAHLHQVQAASGLPLAVLALAAGVSPALVRHLVLGRNGRRLHRLSPESARRLIALDARRLAQLATEYVPARPTAERVQRLLLLGHDPGELARWCRLSRDELAGLAGAVRCSRLVALLVRAACGPVLAGDVDEDPGPLAGTAA